jgi:hypothetical protein
MTLATDTAITAGDEWTPPTRRRPPSIHEDALLTGRELSEALTEAGFPTAEATLTTKRCRGGGPPYQLYGRKPLYRWGSSLAWARSRLSRPVNSTSELDRPALP